MRHDEHHILCVKEIVLMFLRDVIMILKIVTTKYLTIPQSLSTFTFNDFVSSSVLSCYPKLLLPGVGGILMSSMLVIAIVFSAKRATPWILLNRLTILSLKLPLEECLCSQRFYNLRKRFVIKPTQKDCEIKL